jgi:hypothetical protein
LAKLERSPTAKHAIPTIGSREHPSNSQFHSVRCVTASREVRDDLVLTAQDDSAPSGKPSHQKREIVCQPDVSGANMFRYGPHSLNLSTADHKGTHRITSSSVEIARFREAMSDGRDLNVAMEIDPQVIAIRKTVV